jgi:hypothetical protein
MFRKFFRRPEIEEGPPPPPPPLSHTVGLIGRLLELSPDEWVEEESANDYVVCQLRHPLGVRVKVYDHYGRSVTAVADTVKLNLQLHEETFLDDLACRLVNARKNKRHEEQALAERQKIKVVEDKIAKALFG